MVDWILWKIRVFLTDKKVGAIYKNRGIRFGDLASYANLGVPMHYDKVRSRFKLWESEYVNRGYKAVPIESFISCGGFGVDIDHLFMKRDTDVE